MYGGKMMNRKLLTTEDHKRLSGHNEESFFTETVDAGRISPLAFFEAANAEYKDHRFYWQNADKTLTLVGIGHAAVLTSNSKDNHFSDISTSWKQLCESLIKEEKDMNPILFGGFTYDPQSKKDSVWNRFESAHFVVPSFQLSIKNGKTTISINLVTEKEDAVKEFDALRVERDKLIHIAQLNEFEVLSKPQVIAVEEIEKERYLKAVKDVTCKIKNGEADKVVIARSVKLNFQEPVQSACALHHISNEQQESYHFGLEKEGQLFFGASPERLIEIRDGKAYSACVAGSIKRGKTAEEDRELGKELLQDSKNREEHQYVVDMITNVFSNECTRVKVPKSPTLLKIRDIQHLLTPVEGVLNKETDIFGLVKALHPTPALGGVPTRLAMEIIREEEDMDRGYYAAPIGWTDAAGNGEFAVAIRSALLDGDTAHLFAGGGIVADSEPITEYEETWVKFRPVMRALGGSLNG